MTLQKQLGFWLAALLAFILFLWALQDILLPFIAGFVCWPISSIPWRTGWSGLA
jgi:predicted PurR-regulated permease PerM